MTIDQLSKHLGVSRSTVYKWVGDIRLPGSGPGGGFTAEARKLGNKIMRERRRWLRETQHLLSLETYANLRSVPGFRDFIVTYIAVGKRSDPREVSISHPDPAMMRLATAWIRSFGRNKIRYRLCLPEGRDDEAAKAFWAEVLDIPPELIKIDRPRRNPVSMRAPAEGTMRVSTTDTLLMLQINVWIESLLAEKGATAFAATASDG